MTAVDEEAAGVEREREREREGEGEREGGRGDA